MIGSLQDVNSAITVHNNLQGAILASSDRGGMRLQYPFLKILFISGYIEIMVMHCSVSNGLNIQIKSLAFLSCPSLQEFFNIVVFA